MNKDTIFGVDKWYMVNEKMVNNFIFAKKNP